MLGYTIDCSIGCTIARRFFHHDGTSRGHYGPRRSPKGVRVERFVASFADLGPPQLGEATA
jgi:hypothetical protein